MPASSCSSRLAALRSLSLQVNQALGNLGQTCDLAPLPEIGIAAGAVGLRDRGDLVEGAAKFEGAGPLQHLRLQKHLCAGTLVEHGEGQQRGADGEGRDHARCGIDVGRADW